MMTLPPVNWQARLDQLVQDGQERGIQLAIYHEGKLVVQAQAGTMAKDGPPVGPDSLFPVFSVSKGIAATVLHRLVARGLLSYDMPIVEAWPEFGVNGKETITLRHALDHVAGLPHMPEGLTTEDLADWEKMTAAIADLVPVSRPGEKAEYHAMTFGWIIGELARRVDGRSFSRLVEEEICQPLGTVSLYIGLPAGLDADVAELEETHPPADLVSPAIPACACPLHALMNRADMRRACIPASNGIMSAEALARHYAALLPGGVDGVELLSPEQVRTLLAGRTGDPAQQWFYGYSAAGEGHGTTGFGHAGYGGSTGFADVKNRLAFGLTRNSFDHGGPAFLLDLLYGRPAS